METMEHILKHYGFTRMDEANLKELAEILLPASDSLAKDFYEYLMEDPYTRSFFETKEAVRRREETIKAWFKDMLTARYDNRYLNRLKRIGQVHVKIGLRGHYVNASMNFIRNFCVHRVRSSVADEQKQEELLETLHKAIDIDLDVMTSSYREAELKKVFLSHRVESVLVLWSERLLHGLNLVLLVGLMVMATGVVALLGSDIIHAFSLNLEVGVIKALGSLLILWMMVELLHTQVEQLRGGKLRVRLFIELAMVALIRKLFVASIEFQEPIRVGLFLAGLLILGVILFFVTKSEEMRNQ